MKPGIAKAIAEKLVTTQDFRSLSPDEVEALRSLAGISAADQGAEEAVPVWRLMQGNALRYGDRLEDSASLDEHTNRILRECCDVPLSDDNELGRYAVPVRRSRLLEVIKEKISNESLFTLQQAVLLAGVTDLKELAPLIASKLEDGAIFIEPLGEGIGASMITSLAMLDAPRASRAIASLRGNLPKKAMLSIAAFYSRHPDQIPAGSLPKLFQGEVPSDFLFAGLGLFDLAAEAGVAVQPFLDTMLQESLPWEKRETLGTELAALLVRYASPAQIKSVLTDGEFMFKDRLLLKLCWSERRDALGILRGAEGEDQGWDYQMLRRLAIATLDDNPLQPLDEGSAPDPLIAQSVIVDLWASLRRNDGGEIIQKGFTSASEEVRVTARCVQLLLAGYDKDEMEYLAATLFNSDANLLAVEILMRALEVEGVEDPPSIRDHKFMFKKWDSDAALTFYKEHPLRLMKRLIQGDPRPYPTTTLMRAVLLAGVIGGSRLKEYTEHVYVNAALSGNDEMAGQLYLALAGMGGAVTPFGRTLDRLLLGVSLTATPWEAGEAVPLMLFAAPDSKEISRRALTALAVIRPFPEQLLEAILYASSQEEKADAVADALQRTSEAASPLAATVKRITSEGEVRVEEVRGLDMLLLSRSTKVRGAIAEKLTMQDPLPAAWSEYVSALLWRPLGEASATHVYRTLGRRVHEYGWIGKYLMLIAYDGRKGKSAIRAIGELEDPAYVFPLLEFLSTRDPQYVRYDESVAEAVHALLRILSVNPAGPVIAYSSHDPADVNRIFSMDEHYSIVEGNKGEALRLMLLGLERRKDPSFAAASLGKKVLLQHVDLTTGIAGVAGSALSRTDVERLAVYLKVQYVDEDTGTIVAEVGETPTGEIVNALFENRWYIAFRAVWS